MILPNSGTWQLEILTSYFSESFKYFFHQNVLAAKNWQYLNMKYLKNLLFIWVFEIILNINFDKYDDINDLIVLIKGDIPLNKLFRMIKKNLYVFNSLWWSLNVLKWIINILYNMSYLSWFTCVYLQSFMDFII